MSTSDFKHRAYLVVPAGLLDWANAQAAAVDPDAGGAQTFGAVALSPTGEAPATHYAASTRLTDNGRAQVEQLAAAQPGAHAYFEAEGWTWETALEDLGLSLISLPTGGA